RAAASSAHASALRYLVSGRVALPDDAWERRHALAFELELHRAECEYLTGDLTSAEGRLSVLSARAASPLERARVARLLASVYFGLQRPMDAFGACLPCLREAGIEIPARPTREQAQAAYQRTWSRLEGRSIDELVELPLMTDPTSLAIM